MRTVILITVMAMAAQLAMGCTGSRKIGICAEDIYTKTTAAGDPAEDVAAAKAHWEKRVETDALRASITSWNQVVAKTPASLEAHTALARAYYFLADGHLKFDEEAEDEMLTTYEQGTYHAEFALGLAAPEFRKQVCDGEDTEDVVSLIGEAGAGPMYWYATNLGKWALAKGILVALGHKDDIFAMMTRLRELDADYFYGAPGRYFGAYYTKIPFPGGDEELSLKNFEESIAMEPNYFATRVLLAELLATKMDDRALFEKHLRYVLDTAVDVIPAITPENTKEKAKAEALMDEIDVFFDPPDEG